MFSRKPKGRVLMSIQIQGLEKEREFLTAFLEKQEEKLMEMIPFVEYIGWNCIQDNNQFEVQIRVSTPEFSFWVTNNSSQLYDCIRQSLSRLEKKSYRLIDQNVFDLWLKKKSEKVSLRIAA